MTTWVSENGFWACRTEAASISRKVEGSKKGSQNVGNVGRKVASVSDYIYIYISTCSTELLVQPIYMDKALKRIFTLFSARYRRNGLEGQFLPGLRF